MNEQGKRFKKASETKLVMSYHTLELESWENGWGLYKELKSIAKPHKT